MLNARTYNRLLGTQARHTLALHVSAHQCSVRVVVFQERNQGRCAGHNLSRRHVHVLDAFGRSQDCFPIVTSRNEFLRETTVVIHFCIGLSNDVLAFFNSRQIMDFFGRHTINNLAIRRLKEAVLIQTRIQGE